MRVRGKAISSCIVTLGHAIQSLCGLTWFKRAFGAARATALTGVVLATAVLSACDAEVPDRSPAVDRLVQQIAAMPGVQTVSHTFNDRPAQDMVNFNVGVEVSDGITGDQLAAITSHYLSALASGAFNGYRAELDVRRGWNVFAVDSGNRAIANTDQIIGQARDWVDLRHEFNSATVELRATITHPDGPLEVREAGHSNVLRLSLPDPSDFATLADAVRMLSRNFLRLAGMEWTIHSGKLHPAEISFSRRFPSTAELDVWTRLNADQSIPHIDVLRINWSTTPPVWFSEKTIRSHDVSAALELAARHLPIVAELAAPILYSASDQLSGHIGGNGFARGPVAVTVGGCTPRDPLVYKPIPEEQALINRYAKCPS